MAGAFSRLFARKPIASLVSKGDHPNSLRRTLGARDIGTLAAFAIVCVGVLVLRYSDPGRQRPFRVPDVWLVAPLGAAACVYIMRGLPVTAGERFGIWLVLGIVLYLAYGYRKSVLARGEPPVPAEYAP